jgi:hypothetical protein
VNLQEILTTDMDMQSLAALARQGLGWWLDELAQMLPAGWRDRLSSRPRVWAEPLKEGGWRIWRDGQPVAARPVDTRVGLLATGGSVLVRRVPTPRMTAGDVRRMMLLDLDRLSPLNPELVFADIEIADRGDGEGPQQAVVGLLPKAVAMEMLSRAWADGWRPAALGASIAGEAAPHFDFLKQALQAAGVRPPGRIRSYWWAGAVALILINLGVLVGRDMIGVQRLQDIVDAQQPAVEAVQRLRRRVGREEEARRALIARGQAQDPLRIVDVVTRALPMSAWVQRMEWNGQRLRAIVLESKPLDVAAALRGTGAFAGAHAATPPQESEAQGSKPVEVTADVRSGVGR